MLKDNASHPSSVVLLEVSNMEILQMQTAVHSVPINRSKMVM